MEIQTQIYAHSYTHTPEHTHTHTLRQWRPKTSAYPSTSFPDAGILSWKIIYNTHYMQRYKDTIHIHIHTLCIYLYTYMHWFFSVILFLLHQCRRASCCATQYHAMPYALCGNTIVFWIRVLRRFRFYHFPIKLS